MFYFTKEGWKPFENKITYKETKEVYDNDVDAYTGNPDLSEVTIIPVVLTEEQLKRLETIKYIESMGDKDVQKYVFDNIVEDMDLVDLKMEVKAEETRKKLINLIRWDELTTEEMLDLVDDFKEYEIGAFYLEGDIFNCKNQLYKVLPLENAKGHTSQADWIPGETPAIYLAIAPPNVIAEWVQPYGGSQTYERGARVLFEGKIYENIFTGDKYNVWSPIGYPQGWKLIE